MTSIKVLGAAGDFAENKDIARSFRITHLMPALERGEAVEIDFAGVSLSTQSFVHALVSDAMRKFGPDVLDRITFRGCNAAIQTLVSTVSEYMQDGTHTIAAATTGGIRRASRRARIKIRKKKKR